MGVECGTGENLANRASGQSPALLVSLLDNPDIHSGPDVVPCTTVGFGTHYLCPLLSATLFRDFPRFGFVCGVIRVGYSSVSIGVLFINAILSVGESKNLISWYDLLTSKDSRLMKEVIRLMKKKGQNLVVDISAVHLAGTT